MITAAVLLLCFCQTEGATKVMPDDPFDTLQNSTNDLAGGSGSLDLQCCVSGNLAFPSIADTLNNISSNDVIVHITTDVVLSSNLSLEGLKNITIKGHNNPVVKCNDVGVVKFILCKNITIEGIYPMGGMWLQRLSRNWILQFIQCFF